MSRLIRLYAAVGRKWEAMSDAAYQTIRAREKIPEMAATVPILLDGVLVPLAEKPLERQGSGGVTWTEAACETILLSTEDGAVLRTMRHGRMPEGGQAILTLRSLVLSERFDRAWGILRKQW